ncbi:MAG: FHA domain-containing protein [Alphaproteobacteria bacterium]|nr:FHA domain-containing protein [Alphaproteobacteria bacterium]
MATGARIRIIDTSFNTSFQVLALFPVRIGRNALNDVQLSKEHVSQFHVVLEHRGGKLMLRDLGSRNGTVLREGRAPAHELIDLEKSGNQFQLSTFRFEVRVEDVDPARIAEQKSRSGLLTGEPAMPRSRRPTRFEASFAGAVGDLLTQEAAGGGVRLKPPVPAGVDASIQQAVEAAKLAMSTLVQTFGARLQSLPPEERSRLLTWAREALPVLERDEAFRRLQRHSMPPDTVDVSERQRLLEYVAFQGVSELASHYVPSRPALDREDDIIRFLAKLRDVLDGFFTSFVPLRDGYESFRSEMDIERPRVRKVSQMDTIEAVKAMDSPAALAARLLDWREDLPAARKAIEGVFADVMIHHMAVLRGVVQGVQSMIQEISPSSIEVELEEQKSGGVFSGLFRFRELWKLYCARHSDLEDGEKRIFGLVFGPEFAKAYAKMADELDVNHRK